MVDFDGTLCETALGDILVHVSTGTWWHITVDRMGSLDRELLEKNYAIWSKVELSSQKYFALVDEAAKMRDGFTEFLDRCEKNHALVYVVSAGLESYVRHCLKQWAPRQIQESQIIAVPCLSDLSFGHVRPDLEFCMQYPDKSGYTKGHVVRRLRREHPNHKFIAIGDGRSDFVMAEASDLVYARRHLADHLTKLGKPFVHFSSFREVVVE